MSKLWKFKKWPFYFDPIFNPSRTQKTFPELVNKCSRKTPWSRVFFFIPFSLEMFIIKFYYSGILLVSLLNAFLKLQALWILPYEVVQMVHLKGCA